MRKRHQAVYLVGVVLLVSLLAVAQLRANLRRQTRVPQQGGHLVNPNGTAVGSSRSPCDTRDNRPINA